MVIYVFDPRGLNYVPCNQYLDFPDLFLKMIAAGEKIVGIPFNGYWKDLGRPEDYERASQDFEKMRTEFLVED